MRTTVLGSGDGDPVNDLELADMDIPSIVPYVSNPTGNTRDVLSYIRHKFVNKRMGLKNLANNIAKGKIIINTGVICPACGDPSVMIRNVQIRAADEGDSRGDECLSCGHVITGSTVLQKVKKADETK